MAEQHTHEFLALPQEYLSDDDLSNAIQPALDTLFPRLSHRNRSLSPATFSSSLGGSTRLRHDPFHNKVPAVDLRALDYTVEYDSHLMCPICHVPFIDPVVLDCDHTFCASCFDEHRNGTIGGERLQCPSCRTYVLTSPKKASRLISNMCNDIKVHCPNDECITVIARGYIEQHVLKDCLEQQLHCPDEKCEKQTKRKSYVPGQCIHSSHIECDCGAVIELGRGEWLKHKDEDCPNTGVKCEKCGDRIPAKVYLNSNTKHECFLEDQETRCPGEEFGCRDAFEDLHNHTQLCVLARLAPHLSRQNRLLNSLTEQLAQSKMRNEMLESSLERMNDLLSSRIQPKLSHLHISEPDDVEEIERDHIPGTTFFHPQHDLLLPAHIRDLTPSPTFSQPQANPIHQMQYHSSPAAQSTSSGSATNQNLLSLHDSLRNSITSIEADIHQLNTNITELDARSSMQIMNETLRIREDLAHTSAALFSTRAQVQWLLNRERMSMGPGMNTNFVPNAMRGRQNSLSDPAAHQSSLARQQEAGSDDDNSNINDHYQHQHQHQDELSSTTHERTANQSIQSSTTASPRFSVISNTNSTRRPSIRRPSGSGSQERVKL